MQGSIGRSGWAGRSAQRAARRASRAKTITFPRVTIQQFIYAIRRLPADRPRVVPGVWYRTQKEHWLGWLAEYNSTGAYGRIAGKNRDARFAYNHIVESKMLLWLVSAAKVSPVLMRAARRIVTEHTLRQRQSGAIRRLIPWEVVSRALWRRKAS